MIMLPYFTVVPINWLFEYLIIAPPRLAKVNRWIRYKRNIGIILGILSAGTSIYGIFVLAANKTPE